VITIDKTTNGSDGPTILIGQPISWTYVVTNTGNVDLTDVSVTDDQGVTVTCPQTTLAVGASMTCTATGFAVAATTTTSAPPAQLRRRDRHGQRSGWYWRRPPIDIQKTPDTRS
jgi:uncharacterized repeat protein (TIGR01451 family)